MAGGIPLAHAKNEAGAESWPHHRSNAPGMDVKSGASTRADNFAWHLGALLPSTKQCNEDKAVSLSLPRDVAARVGTSPDESPMETDGGNRAKKAPKEARLLDGDSEQHNPIPDIPGDETMILLSGYFQLTVIIYTSSLLLSTVNRTSPMF